MASPALSLEGVVAGYGDGIVLHGAGLQVTGGERVGLVGRNGAGKTTLLRAVMGLLPVREGGIRFGGHRLERLQTFEIARLGIAYVPQGRDIFGDFTVGQNLRLGRLGLRNAGRNDGRDDGRNAGRDDGRNGGPGDGRYHGPDEGRGLDLAYEAFPWLAERARDLAGSLSGGQQQQLAIARALVSRPALLMLDEPLEGIQPSVVEQTVAAIATLCDREGTGLLLVEQDIDAVLALCERVVVIEGGQTTQTMSAAVLRRDRSPIEQALGL